jgi:PAS domain
MIVSGYRKTLGSIKNLNMACSSLFGYTRQELISKKNSKQKKFFFLTIILDKKMDMILPIEMKGMHNSWITNFLESGTSEYLNIEKESVCMHKNGFLIPVNKFVKALSIDEDNGISFIAFFEQKKRFAYDGYLLTDLANQKIIGISAGAARLLGTNYHNLKLVKNIAELFPKVLEDIKNTE